jgi:predicted phosphodiesterase
MRIAFLADIHGNLPALEAVVADLKKQAPDAVYLVGDQINRCPWTNEVLDLIADKGWTGICGNHELVVRHLAKPHSPIVFDNRKRFVDLWWTVERLDDRHLAAIEELPEELELEFDGCEAVRIVHGVPGDAFRGIFPGTEPEQVAAMLENVVEPIVVCGHTHRPLQRTYQRSDGDRSHVGAHFVVNGGSVGIPYNGDARAQYVLLTNDGGRWAPLYRRVEYPLDAIRAAFGRSDLTEAYGPLTEIHLRTVETALPWSSDFQYWLGHERPDLQENLTEALAVYEHSHGPGRWYFQEALVAV